MRFRQPSVRMPPKSKDPNANVMVHEDAFLRARKIYENKIAPKPPKGELTIEDVVIPPQFHTMPEMKKTIEYWNEAGIIRYTNRQHMVMPSRLGKSESEGSLRPKLKKEVAECAKVMKAQVKQAEKRTGMFMKQLDKGEKKQEKRDKLLEQIGDLDVKMNVELRETRGFAKNRKLFFPEYMQGSKFGETSPMRKNIVLLCEVSDKIAKYSDEAKDELTKYVNNVIAQSCESFNLGIIKGETVVMWLDSVKGAGPFQPTTDTGVKGYKGPTDAIKWMGKQVSEKAATGQPAPDWDVMLKKFLVDAEEKPSMLLLAVSTMPGGEKKARMLEAAKKFREDNPPKKKGPEVLPIRVVAFDPEAEGNEEVAAFFKELGGGEESKISSFMVDTSKEDCLEMDKRLKSVAAKRKQLDKLRKKLEKMEDLSEKVTTDRKLLRSNQSLEKLLKNDFELVDVAAKSQELPRDTQGNLILPDKGSRSKEIEV